MQSFIAAHSTESFLCTILQSADCRSVYALHCFVVSLLLCVLQSVLCGSFLLVAPSPYLPATLPSSASAGSVRSPAPRNLHRPQSMPGGQMFFLLLARVRSLWLVVRRGRCIGRAARAQAGPPLARSLAVDRHARAVATLLPSSGGGIQKLQPTHT